MDDLRLLLLLVGLVFIALVYLWGIRKALRQRWEERRRRNTVHRPENEPVLDDTELPPESPQAPYDPYAKERLVDVEIRRVERGEPQTEPAAEPPAEPVAEDRAEPAAAPPAVKPEPAIRSEPAAEPEPAARPAAQARKPERPKGGRAEKIILLTVLAPSGQTFGGPAIQSAMSDLGMHPHPKQQVYQCLAEAEGEPDPEAAPVFGVGHLREPGTFDAATLNQLRTPGLLLFMRLPGPVESLAALELMVSTAGQLAEKLGGTMGDGGRNKMTNQNLAHLRSEVVEFQRRQRLRTAEA